MDQCEMNSLLDVPVPFEHSMFYLKPVLCIRTDSYFR